MNKKVLFGCCLVIGLVACGSGDTGPLGPEGTVGGAGPQGSDGTDGAPGATGSQGPAGAQGDQGEVGATGDAGHIGDMICGETLITAEEWHSTCGSNVGSCRQGQVQCRLRNNDGELVPYRTCYGEVAPSENSGRCDTDADCDGTLDDTTGAGDNVTLVRQALQAECFVSGSSWSCDRTLVNGLCRNARKHCLLPEGNVCRADRNGEGVLWSDFVAAANEENMGFECVGAGRTIRTWECTVDEATNIASVTCTGPRGL